ncbi:DUF3566 domain-containing protein [Candidatus Mycobacterium methanotrophicum]|uniref:DUF3566 domain-containing protein n=1 Tax=Candidatus Mycobacterium methanotrophicum TaxID=2943498 RepID=A0ABY4QJ39_9MYCO|nr:DUF3566 domain-containing protein [Candidatus Mycobacterium methanotrophicum]UQX11037.1 DUF3566 domain-containing protein [Candidatus Mycobacterium methanotrophicum]
MTSPNEPGYPGPGDSPNGHGSADRAGAQRRPPADAPEPRGPRPSGRSPGAPNADARLSRFISGTAAPPAAKPPPRDVESPHPETHRGDAYGSELPDLSGPMPRTGQRTSAAESAADTATSPARTERRIQVTGRARGPVRASMQIRRIDPWSTLKVSLVFSVALFFVWMIAVALLYLVLGGMGVWSKLNSNVGDLLNNTSGSSADLVSSGTIFGGAVLIGLVNIVLLSAMATIGAFVYNLTTDLIGGVEVTLADRD